MALQWAPQALQGTPEAIPQSQRTARGPPPRFGPAECAERLNPPHPAKDDLRFLKQALFLAKFAKLLGEVYPPLTPPPAPAYSAGPSVPTAFGNCRSPPGPPRPPRPPPVPPSVARRAPRCTPGTPRAPPSMPRILTRTPRAPPSMPRISKKTPRGRSRPP